MKFLFQVINKKKEAIIFCLMGCIVFSPLSSFITIDVLRLPISFPEMLFLLFLPFCRKNFQFTSLARKQTLVLLWIWIILIVLALLVGEYTPYAILSTARSYLYLLLFYLLFCKKNNVSIQCVYYISIGAFIGWIADSAYSFNTITLAGEGITVSYGPMLCIPILIGVQVLKRQYKVLVLTLFLSVVLMVLSGMRRQMLITAVSLAVILCYTILRDRKQFVRFLTGLSCFVLVIALNLNFIGETIKSYSGELYFRVITKTETFLQGESNEGDDMRKDIMTDFSNNIETYVFPHGFVSKQTAADHNTGRFNDFPFSELAWTLGIIGAFLLVFYFGYASYRCYKLSKSRNEDRLIFVFVVSFWVMLALLFLEGSFLTFPYTVPFTGYCLGNLQRYARLSFITHKLNI